MRKRIYTNPFGLTSQFSFCSLPLRLDSYHGCSFRCTYCFARYRGGNVPDDLVTPADPNLIRRVFERSLKRTDGKVGVLSQFLQRRVPLHFGGMSDPFQPAESRFRVTEAILKAVAFYQYPLVISTRSILVASPRYLDLLRQIQALVVQFSFSSTIESIAKRVEPRCDSPVAILRAMHMLVQSGINVTCRWQPYIPGVSESPQEFVPRVASTGCRHIALEHLKLPLEHQNPLWQELIYGVGRDIRAEYLQLGAVRDGREYTLPADQKLRRVLEVAKMVRSQGMTFGAADNEFQYRSDSGACCSGVDQFAGFENYFRHQIGYAIRKCRGKPITYNAISREWYPKGSIDRYLNSRSRLAIDTSSVGTIRDHILDRWNNPGAAGNPSSFEGVILAKPRRRGENAVYAWDKSVRTDIQPGRESTSKEPAS